MRPDVKPAASGPLCEATSQRWARARAALLAYLVVFNLLAALPQPGNVSAERLARPFEREELRRWTGFLQGIGIDVTEESLASGYIVFVRAYSRAREIALAPIEPLMSFTLTDQSWRLFATPDADGNALTVSVHSASGTEVLYESGHPERDWNATLIEYRRIRANYSPTRTSAPPGYAGLAARLSELVFASRPDAERVSFALEQRRIPVPGRDAKNQLGAAERRHVIEIARPAP